MERIQKLIEVDEFLSVLKAKERRLVLTKHGREQAEKRVLPYSVVGRDLLEGKPVIAFEQESEFAGERKFNVYYGQSPGVFHRYVVSLNNELRVITAIRSSKALQKLVAGGLP